MTAKRAALKKAAVKTARAKKTVPASAETVAAMRSAAAVVGAWLLAVMDLQQTIRQLEIRKRKIELTIAELEQLQGTDSGSSIVMANRRGRKSMGSEERQQVSERMKRYWANRREQREQVKS